MAARTDATDGSSGNLKRTSATPRLRRARSSTARTSCRRASVHPASVAATVSMASRSSTPAGLSPCALPPAMRRSAPRWSPQAAGAIRPRTRQGCVPVRRLRRQRLRLWRWRVLAGVALAFGYRACPARLVIALDPHNRFGRIACRILRLPGASVQLHRERPRALNLEVKRGPSLRRLRGARLAHHAFMFGKSGTHRKRSGLWARVCVTPRRFTKGTGRLGRAPVDARPAACRANRVTLRAMRKPRCLERR